MITLEQYQDQLAKHDWTYTFSDDARVWRKGESSYDLIKSNATLSKEHEALYTLWVAWYSDWMVSGECKLVPSLEDLDEQS